MGSTEAAGPDLAVLNSGSLGTFTLLQFRQWKSCFHHLFCGATQPSIFSSSGLPVGFTNRPGFGACDTGLFETDAKQKCAAGELTIQVRTDGWDIPKLNGRGC